MKLARRRPHTWFEDEVTAEIYLLAALLQSAVLTVTEDTPLAEVHRMLVDERVPAVIVVDAERTLIGLITRTDVLRVLIDEPDANAAQAMSSCIFAIPVDSSIERAAALMATESVGQLVVTGREGELLGLVSAVDITRHVAARAGYLP